MPYKYNEDELMCICMKQKETQIHMYYCDSYNAGQVITIEYLELYGRELNIKMKIAEKMKYLLELRNVFKSI